MHKYSDAGKCLHADTQGITPAVDGEDLVRRDAYFSVRDEIGVTVAESGVEGVAVREDIPHSS